MKRKRESRRAGAHHGPRRCLAFIGRCSHPVRIVFEIVKEYKYLGITFSNSGLFGVAVEQIACKSSTASMATIDTIKRAKIYSFQILIKLLNALVNSVASYACQVWGAKHMEVLLRVQNNFF